MSSSMFDERDDLDEGYWHSDLEDEDKRMLEEESPSAKLTVYMLHKEGEMPSSDLAEETFLSDRTVRYVTSRLEGKDLIESRPGLKDARKTVYRLAGEEPSYEI